MRTSPDSIFLPDHIGRAGQQDRLDLERGQLWVLGSDQGDNPGHVRRGTAVAGAGYILLVIPGYITIDARRANFHRRGGVVIIGEWIMTVMRGDQKKDIPVVLGARP